MPGGDQTGPLGQGPQNGRAAGYCAGYDTPGYMNPPPGQGGGNRGRGGGRGWRHRYYATGLTGWQRGRRGRGWGMVPPNPVAQGTPPDVREQELSRLQADLRCLEETAQNLRRRINELQAEPTANGAAQPV